MQTVNDWDGAVAPSLEILERLAAEAWERLPREFRQVCGDVVIRIEDFATDEALDSVEVEDPFELMGLYQGVSLDRKSTGDMPREPDMVFLYRRAILDYWAEAGDEALGDIVTHVLVHEIGHHFGLSDEDMERIEAEANS
ncbi:MAG: metallopeptidase family protein [Hyphomicrobiaceae bacterium]|nr:metallopeptidase family protein [Hyphomicrobiaceae bacterium]